MIAFHVVIPARFASTRLPGKALLPIAGKPMVVRVAEQSAQSGAQQIWIATDHQSIVAAVHEYGFKACLTHAHHTSGTDRIAEVVEQLGWPDDTIVVNVQGDEPLMPPALISAVAQHLHDHPECAIATACHPTHDEEAMRNPNIVKVVLDKQGNACISAARRFLIRAMRSPLAQRYRKISRYYATSAFMPTVPAFCVPFAILHLPPSNKLSRWNNCARCGTVTRSELPLAQTYPPVE